MSNKPSHRKFFQSVIRQEAQALEQLASALDDNLESVAVESVVKEVLSLSSAGRLVVSGIGKTGFIAMKISATFSSIGVPSFFLHPAEAFHGDLGRITDKDCVLLLSYSGETEEVLRLIPHLRRVGCRLIAITANTGSTLGRRCDFVIAIGTTEEAGPLGLAPTTSTCMMLAVGDALAMTVLRERELPREQFAFYHPGGALGRMLSLVSEIMRTGDELCIVHEESTARDVLHAITLTKGRPGAAAIVNSSGVLRGVFTDGDFRRCIDKSTSFLDRPIREVMGAAPKTTTPEVLAEEALKTMNHFNIDQVIVVDSAQKPVGMVDIQDILRLG